jgi:hypothetical protein
MQYRLVSIEHIASIFSVEEKAKQKSSGKQAASRAASVAPLNHTAL